MIGTAKAKPAKGTAKRQKAAGQRAQAKADKLVYQAVDARDGHRCRICGEYAGIDIQRHHIRGRKFTTLNDVCHLCDDCHGLLHVRVGGKLLKVYGDANVSKGLTVETKQNDRQWRVESGF
jgi:hypothetical protein